MAIHRGIQSVLFFYLSCTPCIEKRNMRERKRAATAAGREALEKLQSGCSDGSTHVTIQPHHTNPAWDLERAIGPGRDAMDLARQRAKNDGRPNSKGSTTTKSGWKCSIPDAELDARVAWAKTFQRDDDPLRPYYKHPQMAYSPPSKASASKGTPSNAYQPSPQKDDVTESEQQLPKSVLKKQNQSAAASDTMQMPARPQEVRFRRSQAGSSVHSESHESESDNYLPCDCIDCQVKRCPTFHGSQLSQFFPDTPDGSRESVAPSVAPSVRPGNYYFSPPAFSTMSPSPPGQQRKSTIRMVPAGFAAGHVNPPLNDLHPPTVTKIDHPAEVAWMREPPPPTRERTSSEETRYAKRLLRSLPVIPRSTKKDCAGKPQYQKTMPLGETARQLRRRDSGTSSDW